jgi:uncharacterized protein (TIGR02246 family)
VKYLPIACLATALALALPPSVRAQGESASVDAASEPDEAALQKAIATYTEAFNRGDATATAAHWSEIGTFENASGVILRGREALQASFAAFFAEQKQAKIELLDTSLTLLSPHVARETGLARVIVPGEEPNEAQYEAIHIKTPEGWKIDSVREQEASDFPPSHYERLKVLEWMIGSWTDQAEIGAIVTSCRWTTNENFLVQTFKVVVEDRVDFEGTQVIGWDPHSEAIRSWVFDSDGGFGVGRWTGEGNRWTVQTLNTLPDGRRGSSTNVYDVVDENTVRFSSIGRQVEGELLQSIEPIVIVRAPIQ